MGDIYGVEDYIKRTRKLLKHADMRDSNKYHLNRWIDHLMAENSCGGKKIYRYVQTFRVLSAQGEIEFDLAEAEKDELKALVGRINQNRISGKSYQPESQAELKKAIRKFYQFVYDEEDPELVSFISCTVKEKDKKDLDISSLPTPGDVASMYEQAQNPRDKAFLLTLWESGARIGELLELHWADINDKGIVFDVFLDGKTGGRTVPVTDCVPILRQWKEVQDHGGEGYVFTSFQGGRLSYGGAKKRLDVLADRGGVERKHNPHAFRKSRATFMAHQGANAFQLMKMFGWSKVETAKTYVQTAKSRVEGLVIEYSSRSGEVDELEKSEDSARNQWDESPAESIEALNY